ncbi:MAG: ribonuclease P protein component [Caldimicrobium sp.]
MKKEGLSKKERLSLNKDFARIFKEGEKLWIDKYLLIIYCPNELPFRRLGLIVSSKVGKAVERNKVKRILRELFRRNKDIFPENSDIVMIASPKIKEIPFERLLSLVKEYLSSAKRDCADAKKSHS